MHVVQQAAKTARDGERVGNFRHVLGRSHGIHDATLVLVGVLLGLFERRFAKRNGSLTVKVEDASTASVSAVGDADVMIGQFEEKLCEE